MPSYCSVVHVEHLRRLLDDQLVARLSAAGAVLIEGPKACGKTQTARRVCASEVMLDLDLSAQQALLVDPRVVLAGPVPRLVDEWQVGGTLLWNTVRREVDERQTPGQFLLTGSATPRDDVTRHSGAGRISRLRMRPMSLYEMGRSTGDISIAGLFDGVLDSAPDPGLSLPDLLDLIAVGGWPANLHLSTEAALQSNVDYLANAREVDVPEVSGATRDPQRLNRLMASLARNTATEVKISVLAQETGGGDDVPLARSTIYDYLSALQRLMLVEDVPAWAPHLRSRAALRKEPKRHFADPALAIAALRTTPARLLTDLNYTGFLFESMVVRDLRALTMPLGASVSHYRDSHGVEADLIVQLPDGRWGAFEVKLGAGSVDEAASSLTRFAAQIDTRLTGEPSVLGVITNASFGYRRPDGVAILPVAALAP